MTSLNEIVLTLKYFAELWGGDVGQKELLGKDPTVVGIHGSFGGWPSCGIYNILKRLGVRSMLLDFGSQTGRIDSYVNLVSKEIRKREITRPILLGISTGGLVTVRYAQRFGWDKVTRIITIATPFSNTKVDYLIKQLPLAQDLPAKGVLFENLKVPRAKLVCIFGKWDQYVSSESAYLEGSIKVQLPIVGHTQLLLDSIPLSTALQRYLIMN